MTRILFHIISGQTMPVFIADQIIGPDKNVYIVTKDSENLLPNVSNTIGGTYDVIYTSAFDFDDLYSKLEKYVSTLIPLKNELVFNFTGGTKIQSLAFFEFANSHNYKSIYINGQNNEIIVFRSGKVLKRKNYSVKIPPEKYLSLSGYQLEFEKNIKLDKVSLSFLNLMKKHYRKFFKIIQQKKKLINESSYIKLYDKQTSIRLVHNNMIYFSASTNSKIFRKVISPGFWLEYLSYLTLKNSGKFDFVYLNTKIFYKKQSITETYKNEIDILAMRGTTPYIFECKTAAVKNDEIDKLNYLRRTYFGRYARIFIIGMNKPTESKLEKIKDNNITFIPFSELEMYINNFNFEENPSLK